MFLSDKIHQVSQYINDNLTLRKWHGEDFWILPTKRVLRKRGVA